jgi:hypothetical protein
MEDLVKRACRVLLKREQDLSLDRGLGGAAARDLVGVEGAPELRFPEEAIVNEMFEIARSVAGASVVRRRVGLGWWGEGLFGSRAAVGSSRA